MVMPASAHTAPVHAAPGHALRGRAASASPGLAITARARLRARLNAPALDRALLDGADPCLDAALALRTVRLMGMPHRRRLAAGLRRTVKQAGRPNFGSAAPVNVPAVLCSRWELLRLADALDDAQQPGDVRGVIRARRLLTDCTSPLHAPADEYSLAMAAEDALQAFGR
jgi:hypothetical protein